MRNRRQKLHPVEIVPATFCIPMLPSMQKDQLPAESLGTIPTPRWFSKPTNAIQAENNRRMAIDSVLERCAEGDHRGLEELLELGEEFGHDPRVIEAMRGVILAGRIGAKRTGRPRGLSPADHKRSLAITQIVEGFRGSGVSLKQVFEAMDRQNFERVPDRTRRNYYARGRKHPAMHAHLFTPNGSELFTGRRAADDGDWVFVPQRIRIEPASAIPEGARLDVHVTRFENTVHFDCRIELPPNR